MAICVIELVCTAKNGGLNIVEFKLIFGVKIIPYFVKK
jgi:hypothetical protein